MTPEEERIRDEAVRNLLSLGEMFEPLLESAEGLKNKMIQSGWSPTAAEQVATEMLLRMIRG